MPIPQIRYPDNDLTGHAVKTYIDSLRPIPRKLTLRPYQFQRSTTTEWWLIPTNKWPAYRFSKLCFHQYSRADGYMFTGFFVERGHDPELAGVVRKSQILQKNWYWFEFLEQIRCGALSTPMKEVLARSGCPLFVEIDFLKYGGGWEQLEFAVRSPTLQFELIDRCDGILSTLNESANLPDMVQRLAVLRSEQDFRRGWFNLVIGLHLRYGSTTEGNWGRAEIWHNALEPWLPWVK